MMRASLDEVRPPDATLQGSTMTTESWSSLKLSNLVVHLL